MTKSPAKTRILSITQKQAHVSLARNKGADVAKGEILVFLDADTVLEKKALEIIAQKFTKDHSSATLKIEPDQFQFSYALYCGIKNNILRKLKRGHFNPFRKLTNSCLTVSLDKEYKEMKKKRVMAEMKIQGFLSRYILPKYDYVNEICLCI